MTLKDFNTADETATLTALLNCCASTRWARAMLGSRPFSDFTTLVSSAHTIWWTLDRTDWLEAFAAHPKIGEKKLSEWCSQEQSGVFSERSEILQGLAEGNDRYDRRFGWIFLINASGKSGSHILEQLRSRLGNNDEDELRTAAAEQAQITALRLNKMIGI